MRAGAYTIHQSLTAEAAAVLKLALGLARRRGHAQVTPLHVAFALLTTGVAPPLGAAFSSSSSSSPAAAYGLLKRACLRSHPAASVASHPLQCRALELCFNVALNRLPTSAPSPHSSPSSSSFASSLIQPSPTLSNALVAALKRAQANQRRGTCVELQTHHSPLTTSSSASATQQPLLAIKVELDQLVISILDDPSVSRVMREAGFSSATVKSNIEEDAAAALIMPSSSSSSPPPPPPPPHQPPPAIPPHFFLDPSSGMWPQFLAASPGPGKDDDVRAVLDVMVRKKQGRTSNNPVVVGDSASMAEAVAGELLRRIERGDVPEDLAGAHLLKLQLSYVHVRLMSRADVDARAAELRRAVDAAHLHHNRAGGGGGGLVVYVGDLRWAIDEEQQNASSSAAAYSPVEHMVAELGRLLDDLRASRGRRAWLVATASYQTYMRWQQRRRRHRQPPSPEDASWALQAVLVPTAGGTGLALNNLHPPTSASGAAMQPAMLTMQQPGQSPFTMAAERDGHEEKLVLCSECSKNYEREASLVKAEADAEGPRASLPAWLVPDRQPAADQAHHHKDKYLMELKRKWSRLCRKLHLCSSPPCPWWSGSCLPPSRPSIAGFLGLEGLMAHGKNRTTEWSPPSLTPPRRGLTMSLREPGCHQDVGTALALGSLPPLSDTASSDGRDSPGSDGDGSSAVAARELEQRLRRNLPWQPAAVAAEIAEAVTAGSDDNKGNRGVWLYVKGSDHTAVRRAAAVIAEARCGSAGRVVVVCAADPSVFSCAEEFCADVVSRANDLGGGGGGGKVVLVVGDVERAPEDVVDRLVAASRSGILKDRSGRELDLSDCVVVLTTAKLAGVEAGGDVISLRLWSQEDEKAPSGDLKRKANAEPSPTESKRPRHDAVPGLDLNINLCADDDSADDDSDDDDDEEAIPSDITHEGSDDEVEHQPHNLLESVASRVVALDDAGRPNGHLRAELLRALGQPGARVDDEAVEALAAASGHFLDETLERWAAKVLSPAAATVRNGGKGNAVVVLGVGRGGVGARQAGFMGSVLPSRVQLD